MKTVKTEIHVHKVHRKNNGAFTVGLIIKRHMDNGSITTKYANQKYSKKPVVGTVTEVTKVVTEKNKNGFSWVSEIE